MKHVREFLERLEMFGSAWKGELRDAIEADEAEAKFEADLIASSARLSKEGAEPTLAEAEAKDYIDWRQALTAWRDTYCFPESSFYKVATRMLEDPFFMFELNAMQERAEKAEAELRQLEEEFSEMARRAEEAEFAWDQAEHERDEALAKLERVRALNLSGLDGEQAERLIRRALADEPKKPRELELLDRIDQEAALAGKDHYERVGGEIAELRALLTEFEEET